MSAGLAQRDYAMFERNIAYLASRGREVRIILDLRGAFPDDVPVRGEGAEPGLLTYVGFIAGLDEGYLQLCRTDNQYMVQMDRLVVAVLEDTGMTLYDYEDGWEDDQGNERDPLDDESIERLKRGTRPFSRTAHAVFEEGRSKRSGRNTAASSSS